MSLLERARRFRSDLGGSGAIDERALIEGVGARDLRAFERLYRLYQPRLGRFLANILRRPQLVEEVMNDTMMTVWQSAGDFRGASKPSTWIFAIAYRKALKARARWPEPVEWKQAEDEASDDRPPDDGMKQERLHSVLMTALERLSPEQRAVVDLTYFHELGYREIAEIVDCPVDTVKTRMFHARRKLRHAFSGQLADWL